MAHKMTDRPTYAQHVIMSQTIRYRNGISAQMDLTSISSTGGAIDVDEFIDGIFKVVSSDEPRSNIQARKQMQLARRYLAIPSSSNYELNAQ